MNISFNWLEDLIEVDLSVEETAAALTRVGLAVEGVHTHGVDRVLDIDLTSNRPDCLSHLGIARELGVVTGRQLKAKDHGVDIPVPSALTSDILTIEDPDLCHRFTARIIRGVRVGPSPQWLVDRLEAVGERSINNVADVTNYVMLELGQPMHAFDLDKLEGGRIVVRRARAGEKILTLKEESKDLDPDVLAICDAEKPAAIGGIIGGLDSSITNDTVNVLLEVAYFRRDNIRASSRRLNIATEASYRFERGVDVQNLQRASDRAADLICELAGGVKGDFYDLYPEPQVRAAVISSDISGSVQRLTGLKVDKAECDRILGALGIKVQADGAYISPSWRHDIAIEEDLVEEIVRHAGYENIGTELPPAYGAGEYQPAEMRSRRIRSAITGLGFDEAIAYSFIDVSNDDLFDLIPECREGSFIELKDAVIEGAVRMRPTLLPGLLNAVRLNLNHQRRDVKLFEIGRAFAASDTAGDLPQERQLLAFALTGNADNLGPALDMRTIDFFDAKGAVESALIAGGIYDVTFEPQDAKHLRRGQSASIRVGDDLVGSIGRLTDRIAADYKFKQPVYVAELDLDSILALRATLPIYTPLNRYPAITRDVSLIAGKGISWAAIRDEIMRQDYQLCRAVEFVDVFEGKGLEDGERSITIRLMYRSDERTLIEEEVEQVHAAILHHLEEKLGIKPRF